MERPPAEVLAAWDFAGATLTAITHGLINHTFEVEAGGRRYILQRLHPIFAGPVNLDIDAVTRRLERSGLATPRPVPTRDGKLWVEAGEGVFRVLTFLPGRVVQRVSSPGLAREAGALVARFHAAVDGFQHTFHFERAGVHDFERHLARLRSALEVHSEHARYADVEPVGRALLAQAARLRPIGDLPRRIVHGDLKISNVLFDEPLDHALALIDLDTLAHGTVAIDLGDALRSWCNPHGEDEPETEVDVEVFRAAMEGYAAGAPGLLTAGERASVVPGFETIALELAARFCTDALEETYFGWNRERFTSRSEHNLVRARGQLALAASVERRRDELAAVLATAP